MTGYIYKITNLINGKISIFYNLHVVMLGQRYNGRGLDTTPQYGECKV